MRSSSGDIGSRPFVALLVLIEIEVEVHQFLFADLTLDGKTFAVMHGDSANLKKKVLADQAHDYLLQGHTHVYADETVGRTRIINPGALHRAYPKTAALLDTTKNKLEKLIIA